MADNTYGPMGNPSFWGSVKNGASNLVDTLKGYGGIAADAFMAPANRASQFSQATFPGQDWDNSQRNALRHSLWIGGVAQAMGAGPDNPVLTPVAQVAAKGLGYIHEGLSNSWDAFKNAHQGDGGLHDQDTRHDLNANAVGAEMAGYAKTPEELQRVLANMAVTARQGAPVGMFQMSDGRLSFDPSTQPQTRPVQLSGQR